MKIYLAGGFSVSHIKGRERELVLLFKNWKRLYSYIFTKCNGFEELTKQKRNESIFSNNSTRK